MMTENGVEYELLAPTLNRKHYRILSRPDGLSDAEVAESVDSLAAVFGFSLFGDTLSVYTD